MEVDVMRRTILLPLAMSVGLFWNTAWAGDLRCLVTGEGGLQPEVKVTVSPGDRTLTTGRDGMCLFTGLAEGSYRVSAEKVVAGELKGAVRDEVRVPASGRADVRLQLVRAIRIHEYMPLQDGNRWEYDGTDFWGVVSWTVIRTCTSSTPFAGHAAIEVESRIPGRSGARHRTYESSSGQGWAVYGRKDFVLRAGYNPPLLIPDLWPQGHTYRLTATVQYTHGRPDKQLTRHYTLAGFVDENVPAGSFPDCAEITYTHDLNGEEWNGLMRLAKGVGEVSSRGASGEIQHLRSYHIAPRTLGPHIAPLPTPSAPSLRPEPKG
jgi:hypothetical protein